MLLLLDNLEQVIDCAPELSELLNAARTLRSLVTSRELLRIQGEVEYAVPPLADVRQWSLLRALAARARRSTIAELCRRLDNLPLAVELAAARTKRARAASRSSSGSRSDSTCSRAAATPTAPADVADTIDWSYELLCDEEQQLFARLSVFAGGCTLEAAEEVADADLDTLQSLVEKSLLRFTDGRYWMLETIREYAAERL